MNIENGLRIKTILLYIFVVILVGAMLFFLYNIRSNTNYQKLEVDRQRQQFELSNQLIYTVALTQNSVSMFVSTENKKHEVAFRNSLALVETLVDSLSTIYVSEKENLSQILKLLKNQTRNIFELKRRLVATVPYDAVSQRIEHYESTRVKDTVKVSTFITDTVIKTPKKRGFFKRIGDVFVPPKDSVVMVSNRRVDTLGLRNPDSLAILAEVNSLARQVGEDYIANIQQIEKQVDKLSLADKAISEQISSLLLQLHKRTIDSMMLTIMESEQQIAKNYTLMLWGGGILLLMMVVFIVMILGDINREEQSRKALEKANRTAHEVMESRHQLLLAVSHDIKTPLNSIMGHLELAATKSCDIHSMQNSSRHILALLENLLEFSSLEQGTLSTTVTPFDLNILRVEIRDMFAPLALSKNLIFNAKSDNIVLMSDQIKIKQITINLVSNAIKYTAAGSVALDMNHMNDTLTIRVCDSGAGIPEEKINELFKPFSRIERNNKMAHGSGLGLYVTKGLIELLHGSISVTSEVNSGTAFEVHIPVQSVTSDTQCEPRSIGVFDDDPVVVAITKDMLGRLGHKTVTSNYDLILTDLEMGDVSGVDILKANPTVPVVVMTGRGDFTTQQANELGFSAYISKPFTIHDLERVFGRASSEESIITDFLGDDRDEILELFKKETISNFDILRRAMYVDDFILAQSTCHRMLPMFAQLGYPTEELIRMDKNRGKEYPEWKEDVVKITLITI